MKKEITKHIMKDIKSGHKDIMEPIKRRPGFCLALGVLAIIIALGNPFVVGAILGGFLSVRKTENSFKKPDLCEIHVILSLIIGAILGGITVLSSVFFGSFFGTAGIVLGSITGIAATLVFITNLSKLIVSEIMNLHLFDATLKRSPHSKATLTLKRNKKFS